MKIPVLTKKRLQSVGIYANLSPSQKKALRDGSHHELEHIGKKDNPLIAVKIAWQHLKGNPTYYKKLEKFVEK